MNKLRILLLLIIFIAFFLRFYKLSEIPNGLYQDETAIGYNAYSILETGKDEHGKTYPVYFKSFGDYKLPVYFYLTSFSVDVFGLNAFAVRFPSAFLGSLAVIVFYFLLKDLTQNKTLALVSAFFLAVNPWHLHFSRAGFEVNIALFFTLVGCWIFIKGIESKRHIYFYPAILAFVLSVYSYNVTRLLSPLILGIFIVFYFAKVSKISKKQLAVFIIFSIVILLPFIYTFFSSGGVSSARGALLTSADVQAESVELRSYLFHSSSLFGKIFFNSWVLLLWYYLRNLASAFSTTFFFVSGSLHGNQGIGNFGAMYLFQIPLCVIGIVSIVRKKVTSLAIFIAWAIVTVLVLSLSKEVPHATRGYFLVIPLTLFSSHGVLAAISWMRSRKEKWVGVVAYTMAIVFIFYNFVYYFTSYYVRFPIYYAKSWRSEDRQLAEYISKNEHNFEKIIIDKKAGFVYTSLLFYAKYPSKQFLETVVREPDDSEGFSNVVSFGKYLYKDIDWTKDYTQGTKILFITTDANKPKDIPSLKTFYYPVRPVVFSLKERIIQYPVEDVAYIVVATP